MPCSGLPLDGVEDVGGARLRAQAVGSEVAALVASSSGIKVNNGSPTLIFKAYVTQGVPATLSFVSAGSFLPQKARRHVIIREIEELAHDASPITGKRRKQSRDTSLCPKKPRLNLAIIGKRNIDATTMGLITLEPPVANPSKKKRGCPIGNQNKMPYGTAGKGKKGTKARGEKKKKSKTRKNLVV